MGLLNELRRISFFRRSGSKSISPEPVEAIAVDNTTSVPEPEPEEEVAEIEMWIPSGCYSGGYRSGGEGSIGCSVPIVSPDGETPLAVALSPASSSSCVPISSAVAPAIATVGAEELVAATSPAPRLTAAVLPQVYASPTKREARAAVALSVATLAFEEELVQGEAVAALSEVNHSPTLVEVHEGIGKAFGQVIATSLQSSKWDKRCEAIKAMGQTIKGLDLRGMQPPGSTGILGKGLKLQDRLLCWRLSCQLLSHMMRDRVMPVRLALDELFVDTFSNMDGIVEETEATKALDELLGPVIERLGDSSLRLHESARRCVGLAAGQQLLGMPAVLAKLRARLQKPSGAATSKAGDRVKLHFGILDTVKHLLTTAQESLQPADIACFISAGMDDSLGARVRDCAVALAVLAYQVFGAQGVEPVLAKLRPAKQHLLRKKFEGSEEKETVSTINSSEYLDNIASGALKPPPGYTLPPIRGSLPEEGDGDDEEFLMDNILEEAGMVFSNTLGVFDIAFRPVGYDEDTARMEMLDESKLLEAELLSMGIDIEGDGLEEQKALLSSLQDDQDSLSVEVF
jgi:hypothetical protein